MKTNFILLSKKWLVLGILLLSFLVLQSSVAFALTKPVELVGATINPESHYLAKSLIEFAEIIEEKSNGELKTKVFTGGQLGDASSIYESVIKGNIDVILSDFGWFGEQNPEFKILGTYYLFKDRDHYESIVNTPGKLSYFENLILEDPGLRKVYYVGGTERDIISTFPIYSIDDLKGHTMRSKATSTEMEWWKLLGANPVPVAFKEVYTAVQTGVVEGSQNSPDAMLSYRFVEVNNYVARTQHSLQLLMCVMNNDKFESLPKDLQKIILEAGREVQLKYIAIGFNEVDEKIKTIEDKYGLEVTYPDKDPFIKVSRKQMWTLAEEYGITDLVKEIFE